MKALLHGITLKELPFFLVLGAIFFCVFLVGLFIKSENEDEEHEASLEAHQTQRHLV